MTPSGIEPATFRFVAQHYCATTVPEFNIDQMIILICILKERILKLCADTKKSGGICENINFRV